MYFTSQCQYSEQINEFHGFLSVVDHFHYEIKANHGGFGAQADVTSHVEKIAKANLPFQLMWWVLFRVNYLPSSSNKSQSTHLSQDIKSCAFSLLWASALLLDPWWHYYRSSWCHTAGCEILFCGRRCGPASGFPSWTGVGRSSWGWCQCSCDFAELPAERE